MEQTASCSQGRLHGVGGVMFHPCIHTSMYPSNHASEHPYPCIQASIHPSIHASIHPCTHASKHPCTQASKYPSIHVSKHPCIPTFIHPYIHASKYPCIHISMHSCIHIIQSSIHPYMHISILLIIHLTNIWWSPFCVKLCARCQSYGWVLKDEKKTGGWDRAGGRICEAEGLGCAHAQNTQGRGNARSGQLMKSSVCCRKMFGFLYFLVLSQKLSWTLKQGNKPVLF